MRWMLAVVAIAAACGGSDDTMNDEPIRIGLNLSLSGDLAQFGSTCEEVVRLAADEINAQGGVNGRPLELVVLDDGTDSTLSAENTDALIARGDIAAMIGPVFSGASAASIPAIKAAELVSISGSATASSLSMADDGGFFFRVVPDDNFQAVAMGKYLREVAAPPEDRVVLVFQTDQYGQGLADAFTTAYTTRGGVVAGSVSFTPNLATQAAVDAVWSEIALSSMINMAPMVVLITFSGDGAKIIQTWDDSGELPALRWFFTDGVRDSNFVQARPAALEGMRGTAPTHRNNEAFTNFAAAYQERYGRDITQEVFQANYYDAIYVLALSLARQAAMFPEAPLGGANLAAALSLVGGSDPEMQFAPGDFAAATAAIAAGGDVNYDGAAGPCDFDLNGESVGPIEVWQITGGLYVQDQYFETTDLVTAP